MIFSGHDDVMPTPNVLDLKGSLGETLGATVGENFGALAKDVSGISELAGAEHEGEQYVPSQGEEFLSAGSGMPAPLGSWEKVKDVPELPLETARRQVGDAGLSHILKLPDQPTIKQHVLDIMVSRAQHQAEYQATLARGPQGITVDALNGATALAAGAIDPTNTALSLIPVIGEERMASILARAGTSVFARAGARAAIGGIQGAAFGAATVPIEWYARSQEGQDYSSAAALREILFSAATLGLIHPVAGGGADLIRALRGRPLYPFAPGELHERTPASAAPGEIPARQAPPAGPQAIDARAAGAPEPAGGEAAPGTPQAEPAPAAEAAGDVAPPLRPIADVAASPYIKAIADLPANVQHDNMRIALAKVMDGEPVNVGEVLSEVAKSDPRVAESLAYVDAFHGSPHDFDTFSIDKIGQGEGAQSYGHGLYFAENEAVAREYQTRLANRANFDIPYPPEVEAKYGAQINHFQQEDERLNAEIARRANAGESDFSDVYQQQHSNTKRWQALEAEIEREHPSGRLYKVRIKADREHFLDWDKPLSEQSQHVRSQIRALAEEFRRRDPNNYFTRAVDDDLKAEVIYRYLEDEHPEANALSGAADVGDPNAVATLQRHASHTLHEAGIPGIKYLDQGSRGKADTEAVAATRRVIQEIQDEIDRGGHAPEQLTRMRETQQQMLDQVNDVTRNFVVFNDKDIEITHKNGEPVKGPDSDLARAVGRELADNKDLARQLGAVLGPRGGSAYTLDALARDVVDLAERSGSADLRVALTRAVADDDAGAGARSLLAAVRGAIRGGELRDLIRTRGQSSPGQRQVNAATTAVTHQRQFDTLSRRDPPENDPTVIAQSSEAERAPEPASIALGNAETAPAEPGAVAKPSRRLASALKDEALASADYDAAAQGGYLSADEMRRVDDALAAINQSEIDYRMLAERGAACLAAAVG